MFSIWRSLPERKHRVMRCCTDCTLKPKSQIYNHMTWKTTIGSPVIEASTRGSKRLIKYVQLLRKSEIISERKLSHGHFTSVWASVYENTYLWLCLDAGCWDVADLDERLGLVIIVVRLLWIVFIRDNHHWLHVLGKGSCMQEVRRGLKRRQIKGG